MEYVFIVSKRKMTKLTNEELEEIVRNKYTPEPVKDIVSEKQIVQFIRDLKIKEGKYRIPNYALYYKYARDWQPKGGKLTKIGFLRGFSQIFEQKRTNSLRYYLLNVRFTKEFIETAKEWDKKYGRQRKSTTYKKEDKTITS